MIKIDGEKIKALREQQGLTQLYMATAVGVTTDTISRWENKRYPTIKEENAEKLAEALEVEISEILLVEEEPQTPFASTEDQSSAPNDQNQLRQRFPLPLIIVSLAIILSLSIIAISGLLIKDGNPELSATRIMPERVLPNTPFPVIIKVLHSGGAPLSIILKESLPQGSVVLETSPPTGSVPDENEVKWLKKVDKTTRFSYLVKINGTAGQRFTFNGTLSTANRDTSIPVSGADSMQLGPFHWADSDGDNRISDQEILTVFDYYSGIDDFTVDIEFIEKIWLGSGYSWDEKDQKITITP